MDWLLRRLADRLGVAPAQAGEAIAPRLQFEQPFAQWLLLLLVLGSVGLIIWLYRREGNAPMWYKMMLATLRISLVLLALFMLSEAVLSVDRTGLPYFIVMTDDSASAQVVDQFADPKRKDEAAELAKAAGKPETQADRLSQAQGLILRDDAAVVKALQKAHKIKFYAISGAARSVAEIARLEDTKSALESFRKIEAAGDQTRLGKGIVDILTELRGAPPTAILL